MFREVIHTESGEAIPGELFHPFGGRFRRSDQDEAALSSREAQAAIERWKKRRDIREAEEAAEADIPEAIIAFWARGPTSPSLVINSRWLTCKEAALLAQTSKPTSEDYILKESYSAEARKAEKEKIDKRGIDLLHALIEIASESDFESEFGIDEDGHWHVRGDHSLGQTVYES